MSITNFSELKEAVYGWLLRDSTNDLVITNARVEDYIAMCEAELSRELKIRELEGEDDALVTVSGTSTVALPADFRSIISLEFDAAPKPLDYVSEAMMNRLYPSGGSGKPDVYTVIGSHLRFAPVPDAAYGLYLRYYKTIPALSDSNTSNDILTKYPDVYLYGALKQALLNIMDEKRLAKIEPIYTSIVNRIKDEDKNAQIPKGTHIRARNPIG